MSTETKCPFNHIAGLGRTNRDWWPNQLDLSVLHTHSHLSSPMEDDFNYAEQFKSLDVDELRCDLIDVMTTSQADGMQTLEMSLSHLVLTGVVSYEDAIYRALTASPGER